MVTGLTEDPRLDTAEILRVATRVENELEKFDIFMHIAIVNILNQLMQHRGRRIDEKAAEREKRLAEQEPINPHLKQ